MGADRLVEAAGARKTTENTEETWVVVVDDGKERRMKYPMERKGAKTD